jgi:hypothetical protein
MFFLPDYHQRRPAMDEDDLPDDFDGLQYIASYSDLIQAFDANPQAGSQHYLQFGQFEGRETDTFDEAQYLTNYGDLRSVYGEGDEAGRAATVQYIQFGSEQGRTDEAPPEDFGESYPKIDKNLSR